MADTRAQRGARGELPGGAEGGAFLHPIAREVVDPWRHVANQCQVERQLSGRAPAKCEHAGVAGEVALGEMRIAVREVREARLERRLTGEAPVRGELRFPPLEAVVDKRHRIERAVGVVGVELDHLEAHVAVDARQVLQARFAAARPVARLLRKGERVLDIVGEEAAEQVPASRELRLAIGEVALGGAHVAHRGVAE